MNSRLCAADAEKFYAEQPITVSLIDGMTGRIQILCRKTVDKITAEWQLEINGIRESFGRFLISRMEPGETKEFLLSVEVPEIPRDAAAVLIVKFYDDNEKLAAFESFDMFPHSYSIPQQNDEPFITGVRHDVSQAFISAGKLSAVIDANGMRELRYNGEKMLSSGPKLSIFRAGFIPEHLRSLKLERIKISPDRFVSDGKTIECHYLALPARMDLDELEFTQKFTPLKNGSIRCDLEFIVPESFAQLPRLGVVMRLPGNMNNVSFFGCGPYENYPGSRCAIKSKYDLTAADMYPDTDHAVSAGCRSNVSQLTMHDNENGHSLTVTAGNSFSFSALPFDETAIADAAEKGSMPQPDGEIHLFIDCRIGEKTPILAGVFKMTLFFSV